MRVFYCPTTMHGDNSQMREVYKVTRFPGSLSRFNAERFAVESYTIPWRMGMPIWIAIALCGLDYTPWYFGAVLEYGVRTYISCINLLAWCVG